MDGAPTVRPISTFAQPARAGPGPVSVREAAATQFAALQSVTTSADAATIGNAFAGAPLGQPAIISDAIIDPATQRYVYRTIDGRTGTVISQSFTGTRQQQAALSQPATIYDVIIDPVTQRYVFRMIDGRTSNAISQSLPDPRQQQAAYSQAVGRLVAAPVAAVIDVRA